MSCKLVFDINIHHPVPDDDYRLGLGGRRITSNDWWACGHPKASFVLAGLVPQTTMNFAEHEVCRTMHVLRADNTY